MSVGQGGDLTLFDEPRDQQQPAVNIAAFDGATDHQLDEESSITQVHGLVTGHDELLRQLGELAGWEQRRRWMYNREVDEPRLTHEYRDLATAPAFLVELAAALGEYCGVPYDGIWMNWYRDHRDSTSWHADRPANVPQTAIVPVLSLGATRRFLIRPNTGGRSHPPSLRSPQRTTFVPAGGDVLIMRGRCQRDWVHSVPKQQSPAGPRISVNFSSSTQVGA
ncbi:alpha-ketoglutarate-dependent dioxygenase AlkB [Mycobacterium sp. AZCC_0083]|uniref:alpha-ketoglutarate-dependent dioxygenase AlkB n=1 Tax=Mycobacterium sp. AZCC_0083 TaxID=2735882 RepID=UPI001617F078|nr:alpha-ketoglutarate-dependent dioxygenase AlkB [Mycobacterium sp. AZCC_0083]MBB5163130.1 alkylated DNA repair dioxygenase AlkB [Mycobacterium sp. AZCC_0083]